MGIRDVMSERQLTMWERLAVSIAGPVIAGAIIGVYVSINDLGAQVASVSEAMAVTQTQIAALRIKVEGNYTRADAEEAHAQIWHTDKDQYETLKDHEQRIRTLERRVLP